MHRKTFSLAKRFAQTTLGFAACAAITLTAYATVVLDYETDGDFTGFGFVGKGDVQRALGLNNPQLQAIAGQLVFAFTETTTVAQNCQADTNPDRGQPVWTVVGQRTKTMGLNTAVSYQERQNQQVNGFWLNGFGTTTVSGSDGWVVTQNTEATGCPEGSTPLGGQYQVGNSSGGVLTVNGVPLPIELPTI